jgi:hypothetical protein
MKPHDPTAAFTTPAYCVRDDGHHFLESERRRIDRDEIEVIERCVDCRATFRWSFRPSERDREGRRRPGRG